MKVTIIGPNLRDQSKGQFHVHKEGCADIKKQFGYVHPIAEQYTIEAASQMDVVEDVYDFMYEEDLVNALDEFHFAPCVDLPRGSDLKKTAEEEVLMAYANRAYNALDNFPEFGEETRVAIMDTAGDALTDDGYVYDRELLQSIVKKLA